MTICERNGWTYEDWNALSETEQIDRFAFQYRRNEFMDNIEDMFDKRISEDRPIEQTAYVLMLIHKLLG